MRPLIIAGVLLAVLGSFIVFRGGFSFGTQRTVISVGDLEVSAEEGRTIPPWVGGVAIVGGVLLVGSALLNRRDS